MSDLCMEMSGKKVPSVQEMNQAIVHNLVPALLPKYQAQRLTSGASRHPAAAHGIADSSAFRAYGRYSSHTQRFWGRDHEEKWQRVDDESSVPLGHAAFPIPLTRDVAHLCGHPNYKFVDVKYAPQVTIRHLQIACINILPWRCIRYPTSRRATTIAIGEVYCSLCSVWMP